MDDTFGDGIAVVSSGGLASATITGSGITQSARAGISSFGAAVAVGGSTLSCNPNDLDGEELDGPYEFEDRGGNTCGCKHATGCKVLSSTLAPPEAVSSER